MAMFDPWEITIARAEEIRQKQDKVERYLAYSLGLADHP